MFGVAIGAIQRVFPHAGPFCPDSIPKAFEVGVKIRVIKQPDDFMLEVATAANDEVSCERGAGASCTPLLPSCPPALPKHLKLEFTSEWNNMMMISCLGFLPPAPLLPSQNLPKHLKLELRSVWYNLMITVLGWQSWQTMGFLARASCPSCHPKRKFSKVNWKPFESHNSLSIQILGNKKQPLV